MTPSRVACVVAISLPISISPSVTGARSPGPVYPLRRTRERELSGGAGACEFGAVAAAGAVQGAGCGVGDEAQCGESGGVGRVGRVVVGVGVGLEGGVLEWVAAEELAGRRVVIAGAEVLEAGLVVGVLAGVAEWVLGGRSRAGRLAVGVVGVGLHRGAGGVGQRGGAAQLVVVKPPDRAARRDLFQRQAVRAHDVRRRESSATSPTEHSPSDDLILIAFCKAVALDTDPIGHIAGRQHEITRLGRHQVVETG